MHGHKIMFAESTVVSLGIGKIAKQLSLNLYWKRKNLSVQMAPSRHSQMHTAQQFNANESMSCQKDDETLIS